LFFNVLFLLSNRAPELPLVPAVQIRVHVELVLALLLGSGLGGAGRVVLGLSGSSLY